MMPSPAACINALLSSNPFGLGREKNEGNTFVNQGVLNQALFEIKLSPEDLLL
jgi:hypothetical protein